MNFGFTNPSHLALRPCPPPSKPLPRLSAALGGPRLLVKRDDLTGLAFGGNKTRKLEFVLAEAQANGARTLITVGAAQSNHCRQTAALAARAGLDCILVLSGDAGRAASGNLLLDQLFGAEIVWTSRPEREEALQKTFDTAWEEGRRPYLIPLGASNALGALAYEAAFQEFLEQSKVRSGDGLDRCGFLIGRHAGRVGAGRAPGRLGRAGAGDQHRRARARPARHCRRTGQRRRGPVGRENRPSAGGDLRQRGLSG